MVPGGTKGARSATSDECGRDRRSCHRPGLGAGRLRRREQLEQLEQLDHHQHDQHDPDDRKLSHHRRGATTITIQNFAYRPATITVKAGSTITVKNQDSATHTVTADNNAFDTGNISGGASKTMTAPSTPGSFPYHCTIHPFMHGTLTVTS